MCTADAVAIVDCHALDETQTELDLRCGACGTYRRIVTSPAAVELLELRLERQCGFLQELAARREQERMASDADAFVAALRSEIEGAEDFLDRTQA